MPKKEMYIQEGFMTSEQLAQQNAKFAPVYSYKSPRHGENLFIIPRKEFMSKSPDVAFKIMNDVAAKEGVLYGFKKTDRLIQFSGKIQFVKANIKSFAIAVIEGPVFDIGMRNSNAGN